MEGRQNKMSLPSIHFLCMCAIILKYEHKYMGDFSKPGGIKLFKMDELEAFDIDYEWQCKVGELLYGNIR